MPAQVTATGIRDGDPAVLHALVDRRGSAVLAYCERACAPSIALDATAEAFARFRESVLVADRPAALDPEAALLSAVRRAAAARAPRPPAEVGGLGRLLGGAEAGAALARVPELVAAREEGMLGPGDDEILERLLDASPVARAIEERFMAAEEAYRAAPRRPLPAPVAAQLVATMALLETEGNGAAAVEEVAFEPLVAPPAEDATSVPVDEPPVDGAPDEPLYETVAESEDDAPAAPLEEPPIAEAPPIEEAPTDDGPPAAVHAEPALPDAGAQTPQPAASAEDAAAIAAASGAADAGVGAEGENPGEEMPIDPPPTEEWSVPTDDAGTDGPDLEVQAARAQTEDEDAAHLQSASGAVEEPLDDEGRFAHDEAEAAAAEGAPPPADEEPPAEEQPAEEQQAREPEQHEEPRSGAGWLAHLPAHRPHMPARAALAPAGAVVVIAAIGAMVASGVFGGSDPSPPVDTGIVPPRALQAVPEGEAASVVDDLRSAAEDARRRRLADQRSQLATAESQAAPPPVEDTEEDSGAGDATSSSAAPQADEPEPGADSAPAGGEDATGDDAAATEDAPAGDGGTPADDSVDGGTASP